MKKALQLWSSEQEIISVEDLSLNGTEDLGLLQRQQGWVCPHCYEPVYLRAGFSRQQHNKTVKVSPAFCHYKLIEGIEAVDLCPERDRSLGKGNSKSQPLQKSVSRGQRRIAFQDLISKPFLILNFHSLQACMFQHKAMRKSLNIHHLQLLSKTYNNGVAKIFDKILDESLNVRSEYSELKKQLPSFLSNLAVVSKMASDQEFRSDVQKAMMAETQDFTFSLLRMRQHMRSYLKKYPKVYQTVYKERQERFSLDLNDSRLIGKTFPAYHTALAISDEKSLDLFDEPVWDQAEDEEDETVEHCIYTTSCALMGLLFPYTGVKDSYIKAMSLSVMSKNSEAMQVIHTEPGLTLLEALVDIPTQTLIERIGYLHDLLAFLINPNNVNVLAHVVYCWSASISRALKHTPNSHPFISSELVLSLSKLRQDAWNVDVNSPFSMKTEFPLWLTAMCLTTDWQVVQREFKAGRYENLLNQKNKTKGFG